MEDFPNRCLGCKKNDIELNEFKYARTKGFYNTTTYRMSFPVCDYCEIEFSKYQKIQNIARKSRRFTFYLSFLLIFFILLNLYSGMEYAINIAIILLPILIILIIPSIIVLQHPFRVTRFIKFSLKGTYNVKDREYSKEMTETTKNQLNEEVVDELFGIEGENVLYCPKCGEQYKKGLDFCMKCGKDLRVI